MYADLGENNITTEDVGDAEIESLGSGSSNSNAKYSSSAEENEHPNNSNDDSEIVFCNEKDSDDVSNNSGSDSDSEASVSGIYTNDYGPNSFASLRRRHLTVYPRHNDASFRFGVQEDWQDEDDFSDIDDVVRPPEMPFHSGPLTFDQCAICLENKYERKRLCCETNVCDECMSQYVMHEVSIGYVQMCCPSCECFISRDELLYRLDGEAKDKFYRFLVSKTGDPFEKLCPNCSCITKINHNTKFPSTGLKITCSDCAFEWCFPCQTPFHTGFTCKRHAKGDVMLKKWAEGSAQQRNAQKCPRCKIYIQRSSGCDRMTCSRCDGEFCYQCGGRFLRLKYFGDHYSRFSIFGCSCAFLPKQPALRRMIRGALFGGRVLLAPVVLTGVAAVGCAIAAGSVIALPVALPAYAGYKIYKKAQQKQKSGHTCTFARRSSPTRFRIPDYHPPEYLDVVHGSDLPSPLSHQRLDRRSRRNALPSPPTPHPVSSELELSASAPSLSNSSSSSSLDSTVRSLSTRNEQFFFMF